jgi:hypothetical protein
LRFVSTSNSCQSKLLILSLESLKTPEDEFFGIEVLMIVEESAALTNQSTEVDDIRVSERRRDES